MRCTCALCKATAPPGSAVSVPRIGEWYVKDGKVRQVVESEAQGLRVENTEGIMIWTEVDDGE